jgi:ATP-dependent Clp protease ATP-binding subunit ClpC
MNQTRVGPEHLFLGLLQEGSGVAALVLNKPGVSFPDARKEILGSLGRNQPGA